MDYSDNIILSLIRQFRIREGQRYASRQDALVKTALRWATPRRTLTVEVPWSSCTTLEDAMDQFLDRNLYFLPVPRMLQEPPNIETLQELTNIDLFASFLLTCLEAQVNVEHLDEQFDAWQDSQDVDVQRDETFVSTLYNAYLKVCPWLPMLRDTSVTHERLAYVLCLLALDAQECKHISVSYIQNVPIESLKASLESEDIFAEGPLDALAKTDAKLTQKQWAISANLLPSATASWIPCQSTDANQFLQDQAIQQLDDFLRYWASQTDFSISFLKDRAYVENFVDEEPKFGFLIEK